MADRKLFLSGLIFIFLTALLLSCSERYENKNKNTTWHYKMVQPGIVEVVVLNAKNWESKEAEYLKLLERGIAAARERYGKQYDMKLEMKKIAGGGTKAVFTLTPLSK